MENLDNQMGAMKANMENLNTNLKDLKDEVSKELAEIKDLLKGFESKFVSRDRFRPVEAIVYGLAGIILTAVIVAVITVVVRSQCEITDTCPTTTKYPSGN